MFKARRKDTGEVFQVLDTWRDETFNETYFLIWDTRFNEWCWRNSRYFVPPNYEESS